MMVGESPRYYGEGDHTNRCVGSCFEVAWIDDSRFVTCGDSAAINVFQLNTMKPIRTLK